MTIFDYWLTLHTIRISKGFTENSKTFKVVHKKKVSKPLYYPLKCFEKLTIKVNMKQLVDMADNSVSWYSAVQLDWYAKSTHRLKSAAQNGVIHDYTLVL